MNAAHWMCVKYVCNIKAYAEGASKQLIRKGIRITVYKNECSSSARLNLLQTQNMIFLKNPE
jgi:hypothetical protein